MNFLKRFFSSKPEGPAIGLVLRNRALAVSPEELGLGFTPGATLAAMMEFGVERGAVTLAVFADGSASLYFSTAGGFIGAGEHASVRSIAMEFFHALEAEMPSLLSQDAPTLPQNGRTQFLLRTTDGILASEQLADLAQGQSHFSPLFFKAHEVIAAIREVSESAIP